MSKPHYRRTAGGATFQVHDGLQNVVSGMGTSRDKAAGVSYVLSLLTDDQIEAAYRNSDLAEHIIDYPAEDAGREWREWKADKAQIELLEAEEKRLGVRNKVIEALKASRLWGGGAILIGDGTSDLSKPLDAARTQKGGIKYLTVLRRQELQAGELQRDPNVDGYGRPAHYTIATMTAGGLQIHPSRLVVFRGKTIPGGSSVNDTGWGDSVLNTVLGAVTRDEATSANVESLMYEAKVDVIKVKDLTSSLQSRGAAYEELLLKRFKLANIGKGINGALLLDAAEEHEQKTISFGGSHEIMDRFAQRVSAASGIPMTRLYGQSPGGLNSTGEGDLRNYYDQVKTKQTLFIEPEMAILDECLIRSALGDRPKEIRYGWRPLWQPSQKEIAENADKLMSAAEKMERIGAVSSEAIASAVTNAMTEIGAFPGLEALAARYGAEDPDEDDLALLDGAVDEKWAARRAE